MLKRLNNDEALAPYVAQFVPIKIDTGSDDYRKWSKQHPKQGRGIPIVYIVRADGQTMYAKSGSLQTPELAQLLGECLDNCGRIFSQREVTKLLEVEQTVTRLRSEGEIEKAIKTLSGIKKMGIADGRPSFAKPVATLTKHVEELTTLGRDELSKVHKSLAGSTQDQINAIDLLAQTKLTYGKLPTLKSEFTQINRSLTRDKTLRGLNRDVRTLRRYQSGKLPQSKAAVDRAIVALEKIIAERKTGKLVDQAQLLIEKIRPGD